MTDVNASLVEDLVSEGLERREARWLVEEFAPGASASETSALRVAVARRLAGEPLQYVVGHWPFRELDLEVNEHVLIPRPETEELVEVALGELEGVSSPTPLVVDLGTGSGAIAIALASAFIRKGRPLQVVAVDRSTRALEVAERNARRNEANGVTFVHSSWFDDVDPSLAGRVDLVVANPPYVGAEEMGALDPVLGYEPRGALVADDEGDVKGFFDVATIIERSIDWLAPSGVLVCEHGETHREAALAAARRAGYHTSFDLDDLAGKARVLVARR